MGTEDRPRTKTLRWVITALLALAVLIGAVLFFRARAAPRDDILCQKGEIELHSGNAAAAIEQFRRALELNPEHFDAQYGLVRALTAHKDFQEALSELRKLREMGLTAV
ncbi:MAG: tetratricopeptide repeat protein, partial [Candidatus Brocadiae bacterium]|nr:tetratricopeptide repeat protein [Candidatus Brocadiia bacterium]